METLVIDKERTKMIAHRGLSGLETENTIVSFVAAANKSYYGMECDIHRTKDGRYVVFHDEDTKRLSSVSKKIKESTYDELKEIKLYDFESKQEKPHLRIPLLEEYLMVCKKYQKKCIIEFKSFFTEPQIREVLDIIRGIYFLDECIFISFHLESLMTLRKIHSTCVIQYLVSEYEDTVLDVCRKYSFDLDIHHGSLTRERLLELQRHNIKVNAWTVDNPIIALMLIGWGIDFITTNILE